MPIIAHQEKTKTIAAFLKEGQIHWETKLPNGVTRSHNPIIPEGEIITPPAVAKLNANEHFIMWGSYRDGKHSIEICAISPKDEISSFTSLDYNGTGYSSSLALHSHADNIVLAWINNSQAVESLKMAYNGENFSVVEQQEYDFALPIEKAQIRVTASEEGNTALFFQTLSDSDQLSWAVKTPTQEVIVESDFDLGMAGWDMTRDGSIIGVAEILNEGLEDKLYMVKLTEDGKLQDDVISTPKEVLEAQWPQVSSGDDNEIIVTFSARLPENQYQTYSYETAFQTSETPYDFKSFGDVTVKPVDTDELAIISDSFVANIVTELNSNDYLADLGFVLQALSENYGSFSDFIHVDYNSDASTRIIQINMPLEQETPLEELPYAETFVLNPYNASPAILDFFDYIHTDFS